MTSSTTPTKKRARRPIPTPTPSIRKPTIERDALYGAAELRAITGLGQRTIYAILHTIRDQRRPGATRRSKFLVTGAEFLALRAAYYGYADVA